MKDRLMKFLYNRELDIRERLFRVIVILGAAASGLIAVLVFLSQGVSEELVPFLILLAALLFGAYETLRYHRVDLSASVLGVVMIGLVFPIMFFCGGGLQSGAVVWGILEFFYVFMFFYGWRLWAFLILTVGVNAATFIYGGLHPESIAAYVPHVNDYTDSLMGIILVGLTCGAIMQYQIKQYERESDIVQKQKEDLQQANQAQNAFFSSMSHEIRTPMNSVLGLNEMILRCTREEETRRYAENIKVSSKLLLELLNDIIDISQIKQNRMEIVPVEYRPQEMLREIIDMIQIRMMEKKLDFIIDIDENIPSVLYGDEKRIEQIILNILSNAVKYTNEGHVEFLVRAEKFTGDQVQLSIMIWDTGIGIRKEDLETLYDAFRRMDRQKNSKIEGSGLGLSITKQLVNLMGGQITVDSIYTRGTNFAVILDQKVLDPTPIGSCDYLHSSNSHPQETYYEKSFEAPEARLLLVEDNEMNAQIMCKLLAETRVQIDVAQNGRECLALTRKKYYHLILMDYLMPDMNGAETLTALRRQENSLCRETPVILLTASGAAEAEHIAEEYGFQSYLEKPIQAELLEAGIMRFLPEDILEYKRAESTVVDEPVFQFRRKKRRVYITTDCVCDIPDKWLEKYDIKMMYLYIRTDKGRFADTREIDSDNLTQYLSDKGISARSDSVSVAEYEEFFADALSEAENVIHISMAANAGKSYGIAVAAAKGFDHVHVVDSGYLSAGEGLVVLFAARMAKQNPNPDEILSAVEHMKRMVESRFMMPDIKLFYRSGHTNSFMGQLCGRLHVHPVISISSHSRAVINGGYVGSLQKSWAEFIRRQLRNRRKINTDIVFITYVGLSVEQQEFVKNEVLKHVKFDRVILQKAAFSLACNAGMYTIGICYYKKEL
jgi:DegV family protein with EDD domain